MNFQLELFLRSVWACWPCFWGFVRSSCGMQMTMYRRDEPFVCARGRRGVTTRHLGPKSFALGHAGFPHLGCSPPGEGRASIKARLTRL